MNISIEQQVSFFLNHKKHNDDAVDLLSKRIAELEAELSRCSKKLGLYISWLDSQDIDQVTNFVKFVYKEDERIAKDVVRHIHESK